MTHLTSRGGSAILFSEMGVDTGGVPRNVTIDDRLVDCLKMRLARQTGVAAEEIMLKHIEPVTWPDASLGCPKKGRLYAQVLTPGYRLVLSDGITDFEYHTDGHGRAVLCPACKQSEKGGGVA